MSVDHEQPKVEFSKWTPWKDCFSTLDLKAPGVYVLARYAGVAPATLDLRDPDICYFGETCSQTLRVRLGQFRQSAFEGKDGHSGGWTYRGQFKDDGSLLWVAVFPVVGVDDPLRSAFIRYVERDLIWKWVLTHGRLPVCNSK